MTIVIPYKPEVHKGTELKYALRSIEKYLTGWTEIILVGKKPDWYQGRVISEDDHPGRKEFSIYSKMLSAYEYDFISRDSLFWNDDHFLLKHLNVLNIAYWHNGPLENELKRNITARYRSDVRNTLELLDGNFHDSQRPEFNNFDIHTPIVYNKEIFKDLFENRTEEICIKSYYSIMNCIQGEFMKDCKIDGWVEKKKIESLIDGRLFFSSGTNFCTPTVEILQELFPEKSSFEK